MTGVHLFLGLAVVALNALAGAQALARRSGQLQEAVAGWAIGLLGLQVASGMFLLTAIVRGPGVLHVILPVVGFVAVLGARLVASEIRGAALGAAHLLAAVASAFAFFTGLAA